FPATSSPATILCVLARKREPEAVGQGLNRRWALEANGPRMKNGSTSRALAPWLPGAKEPSTQKVADAEFRRRNSDNTNVSAPSASRTTGTDPLASAFVARSRITTPVERF